MRKADINGDLFNDFLNTASNRLAVLVDHRKEFIEYFTKHKEEILINEILLNNRARETLNLVKKVGEYDIYIP